MRTLGTVACIGAILAGCSWAHAELLSQRPPDFEPDTYRSVSGKSQVPPAVLELFSSLCGGCSLADPREPFNATDRIADSTLPDRRLVSAGVWGDRWFLDYEHGGRGLHRHFALFSVTGGAAACLWANGPPPVGCRSRLEVNETCAW
jgi:hypothetical protein